MEVRRQLAARLSMVEWSSLCCPPVGAAEVIQTSSRTHHRPGPPRWARGPGHCLPSGLTGKARGARDRKAATALRQDELSACETPELAASQDESIKPEIGTKATAGACTSQVTCGIPHSALEV